MRDPAKRSGITRKGLILLKAFGDGEGVLQGGGTTVLQTELSVADINRARRLSGEGELGFCHRVEKEVANTDPRRA